MNKFLFKLASLLLIFYTTIPLNAAPTETTSSILTEDLTSSIDLLKKIVASDEGKIPKILVSDTSAVLQVQKRVNTANLTSNQIDSPLDISKRQNDSDSVTGNARLNELDGNVTSSLGLTNTSTAQTVTALKVDEKLKDANANATTTLKIGENLGINNGTTTANSTTLKSEQKTESSTQTSTATTVTSTVTTTSISTTTESSTVSKTESTTKESTTVASLDNKLDKVDPLDDEEPADEPENILPPIVNVEPKIDQKNNHQLKTDSKIHYFEDGEAVSSWGFVTYFLMISSVCVVAYIAYHNKFKIIALVLEGRRRVGQDTRRNNSNVYNRLETVHDAMPNLN